MSSSQEPPPPSNSTTFGWSSSSTFPSSTTSSMETQPSRRPFFFGPGVFAKNQQHPHEHTAKESEGSIESSTPYYEFFIVKKEPANTTDSSSSSSLDNSAAAASIKHVKCDTSTESCLENKHDGEEVSTELTMFHGFGRNCGLSSSFLTPKKSVSENLLAPSLVKFKYCRCGWDDERRMGVSTELRLYDDPWVIKKRLALSDTRDLCRLLVKTDLVEAHILPVLGSVRAKQIHTEKGLQVTMLDLDTGSEHQLIFKKWLKPSSYVFITGWMEQFVKRRGLQEGDEIGLFWDGYSSRFYFRVLALAAVPLAHGNMIEHLS